MKLSGEVEFHEVYNVTGVKGCLDVVTKLGRLGRRRRLKGVPNHATFAGEKPHGLGMIQRNGEVVLHMLENARSSPFSPKLCN